MSNSYRLIINNSYSYNFPQNIQSFLKFLREWEETAKDQKNNFQFITDSTCYGLKISLQGALEICEFLVNKCNFQYLMTARLNQDNLEVSTLLRVKTLSDNIKIFT